ncbi:MAG: ATP-binding protein [Candidatus Pseudobacter hemicellulosilyticus]|uniref:ATP-binding protein n=1 Tax=Candidatus Pseudobacter hemicellulosilyticus TaxID=3121375 RepID=A0AAJ5WTT8_9BACT|nr:MAG: ATP-binding protein [Pseudobacter sp.]
MTIATLMHMRESEDKVEFKEARKNFDFAGGSHTDQEKRRKCLLGYIVAFANEKGGALVLGMTDTFPHRVTGSNFALGKTGEMTDEIYNRLHIRVRMEELYEEEKGVLIIHIPARPVGKILKFEGVPLMRVGGSLRNMSDEEMLEILQEQEPDFSAKICPFLSIQDLQEDAIAKMRKAYVRKQQNPAFLTLPLEQILNDLRLSTKGGLTYAALILLGKRETIKHCLPQARIIWEFRYHDYQIHYDFREEVCDPLFIAIDRIWQLINNKNAVKQLPQNAYIYSTQTFNETVIREAILNAITHRDYSMTSEVVIHQYPQRITVTNPGGFPKGVDKENLINSSSTPRSRLMAEIMEKTGLVERSGQGIDKIYSITIAEGKKEPDYEDSTIFQVALKLNGIIDDQAFSAFIFNVQKSRPDSEKLGVHEIMALYRIKEGHFARIKPEILRKLEAQQLTQRSTNSNRVSLSSEYSSLITDNRIANRYLVTELEVLLPIFIKDGLKVGDLESALSASLNRNQIKYLLVKLQEDGILISKGRGKGTRYKLKAPLDELSGPGLLTNVINILQILNPPTESIAEITT